MNKLYALLIFLIILYVGINVGADNIHLGPSDAGVGDDASNANVNASFPKLDNFTDKKVNDTAVIYEDAQNMTINLMQIDSSQNLSDLSNQLISSGKYTSNQVIDQNGVTTYFLYNEGSDDYSADIYFNKNGQNYHISGSNISYENSDYFINHCKSIIDSMSGSGSSQGFSRW
ncbi:hypothetical protein [Methanobrevibacter sp.]|uniref:hypothetical protein n=1 Tax=Methanobrevibacter sp. TaxID=66852 RepID=UPI00388D3F7A